MNTNERQWPGTVNFIDSVEWLLLLAVERRAIAEQAADELLASGPRELLEEGR